ncbi:iron-containing redox enzyme family protein [Curtobacterium ammoniigenes]|uniref:iron-containing redox enzyme family protein n=1 Tax=Curtobacterium ammoniigenes TaxID=395387 RepID=UPI00082BF113|nr:iron-containing redox enzyme family protein [Curtobacterium ammoniigenes]
MRMPGARGPLGAALERTLAHAPEPDGWATDLVAHAADAVAAATDPIRDDDLQGSLFTMYALQYGGIDGVDDDWEWQPSLLAARAVLERGFETALRAAVAIPETLAPHADAVAECLFAVTSADSGPSLSRFVARKASRTQLDEFLIHRSIYTLQEADPHSWAIPRLTGRAKAALVEIQSDEYGAGRPSRMHSAIFARTVRAAGLDDAWGAYADEVPAITLASLNMMTMFGLHRRLRGAIVGHLAAFEMTSSIPNKLYGDGFRRHGFDADATWYFDEHVEADAVHEQIAGRDLAGGLVEAEPALLPDVLFGAAACLTVDGWVGQHMLDCWDHGVSSLRASNASQSRALSNRDAPAAAFAGEPR